MTSANKMIHLYVPTDTTEAIDTNIDRHDFETRKRGKASGQTDIICMNVTAKQLCVAASLIQRRGLVVPESQHQPPKRYHKKSQHAQRVCSNEQSILRLLTSLNVKWRIHSHLICIYFIVHYFYKQLPLLRLVVRSYVNIDVIMTSNMAGSGYATGIWRSTLL